MYEGNLYSTCLEIDEKKKPKKTNKQEHLEKISALWVPDQMGNPKLSRVFYQWKLHYLMGRGWRD